MPPESKTPDIYELVKKWAFDHFGIPGLLIIAVLAAAFWVYKNWDKVKNWPGITDLLAYRRRWKIPQADPHRYAILIAHLENDTNREHERLIIETLKEFEGVQTLRLDRTISLEGPVPEEMEKRGQEEAQHYLKKSGASVLIWGAVLSRGSSTVYKLYWTPAAGEAQSPKRYDAPQLEAQLRLPEVFWGDLAEILMLQVTVGAAKFENGRYLADRLPPFIARAKGLLKASRGRPGWDAHARGSANLILARAFYILGEQSGQKEHLEEALATFGEALTDFHEWCEDHQGEVVSLPMTTMVSATGILLGKLGRLKEAVAVYQKALREGLVPLDRAMILINLGSALQRLGESEEGKEGTEMLKEAVAAYREALKEFTREQEPFYWATGKHNLANALLTLGERDKEKQGTELLKEAVAACREALEVHTREQVPLYWAETQRILATVLMRLGEREEGKESTEILKEAVAACQEALKEYKRERVPLKWADTQLTLGAALLALGEQEKSLGVREKSLGEFMSGMKCLEEAVVAFLEALEEYNRERNPLDWARTQNNLGSAFASLGEVLARQGLLEEATTWLEKAVEAYKAALEVWEAAQATHYAAVAKRNLQRAEACLKKVRLLENLERLKRELLGK
jgi:tetratricopeptide (TPR) repeat protein